MSPEDLVMGPFELVPIGVVHSSVRDPEDAPRQGREAGTEVEVEIFTEYAEALLGLEERKRVGVVCWMHRARRDLLQVSSQGGTGPRRGAFACRTPNRPNPLAVYPVEVLGMSGTRLRVRGIDAVEGTPVVDLKPYVPRLDDGAAVRGEGGSS